LLPIQTLDDQEKNKNNLMGFKKLHLPKLSIGRSQAEMDTTKHTREDSSSTTIIAPTQPSLRFKKLPFFITHFLVPLKNAFC
jgi:hypothetical protein